MSTFSEIRSLLQQTPRRPLWFALCDQLDDLPEHERDELALPYIEAYTRRWPAPWCEAPQRWIERAIDGDMPPFWALVRHLNLNCHYLDSAQVESLLASTLLERVEILNLDSNRAGEKIGEILQHAPALGSVQTLLLGYNRLTHKDLVALSQARMPSLVQLSLDGNGLEDKLLKPLLAAPWMAQLEALELQQNRLRAAGIRALLSHTPRITHLRLDHIELGGGLLELHAVPAGQLRGLEVYSCAGPRAEQIEAFQGALISLIRQGTLDGLVMLDAGGNGLGPEVMHALCTAPGMRSLERLLMRRSALTPNAVNALSGAAFARGLRRLEIAHAETAREALISAGADINAVVITSG